MKTKGSRDKVKHRKRRSDIGKKRKLYAHKKTKPRRKLDGRFVPYVSKRKRGDLLKVWFWSVEPVSHRGLMNVSNKLRRRWHKFVYGRNRIRVDVEPEMISTRNNIAEVCRELLWEGVWLLKMWGNAKNKYHTSARAVAVIKIKLYQDGLRIRVYPQYKKRSLRRYWFWRDN